MGTPRSTLGDYLSEKEPVAALWGDLITAVYHKSSSHDDVDRLSESARHLFNAGCFAGEMINGGISQFFSNSSGNRAHATLAALRAIGAKLCVELLEKALTLFPDGIAPVDRQDRCELLFAFEERNPQLFDELNQIFDERVDALGSVPEEDLTALELAFMRANSKDPVVISEIQDRKVPPLSGRMSTQWYSIDEYGHQLAELAAQIRDVDPTISIRGDGMARFVYAQCGKRAAELYRSGTEWIAEFWDGELAESETTFSSIEEAVHSARLWLRHD